MTTCQEDYQGRDRRTRCDHADAAAEAAVAKTFAILGVDIKDPKQVKEFQENLRFGERLRIIADKSIFGIVSAVMTLLVGALWYSTTKQ